MSIITQEQLQKLVSSPSLGAVSYQALTLIKQLNTIYKEEYPGPACVMRDVFLSLGEYILEQLWKLYNPKDPFVTNDPDGGFERMRDLGRIIQNLYTYVGYLRESSPLQSPPSIQLALSHLTALFFPTTENGEPICLLRPQWVYNLGFIPITLQIQDSLSPAVLDPAGELGIRQRHEILNALWKRRRDRLKTEGISDIPKPAPPRQLAVLSFAGLDTDDVLLYPILAHELGHFIDYSYTPEKHLQIIRHQLLEKEIEKILGKTTRPGQVKQVLGDLVNKTTICVRELLADLLATRMLGFSFFVAQAEFLKTLSSWPQPTITKSGYPGIQFRLSVIFDHLIKTKGPDNIFVFLNRKRTGQNSLKSRRIIEYLSHWKTQLKQKRTVQEGLIESGGYSTEIQGRLVNLAEDFVQNSIDDISGLAKDLIPDKNRFKLTENFFSRIDLLAHDLPPTCPNDSPSCFSEILSSAWAYQVLHGEKREVFQQNIDKKAQEYFKTCRLTLKSIELLSTSDSLGNSYSEEKGTSNKSRRSITRPDRYRRSAGVLGYNEIKQRLDLPMGHPSHLSILPMKHSSVQASSLDVHLGSWFVVAKRTRLNSVQLGSISEEKKLMTVGREEAFVTPGCPFVIHPGDLILGSTLEFLALPPDLMAFVEGRSGVGRKGLIIATATQIAPGFHGVIVLELANAGTVPLELVPGTPIAQLVFQVMAKPVPKDKLYGSRGKFHCQIRP